MAKELDPLPSSPLVVDVSHSLRHHLTNINHDAVDHAKVIKELKLSIESCGFLYINGCDTALGCDSLYVDNLFRLIGDYFSQPLSEKEKSISKDKARRGYSPSESDNFASLLLQSHTNTYANDTVEKFRIGPLRVPEGVGKNIHFFPNNFEHLSVALQESLTIYYRTMEILRYNRHIYFYIYLLFTSFIIPHVVNIFCPWLVKFILTSQNTSTRQLINTLVF